MTESAGCPSLEILVLLAEGDPRQRQALEPHLADCPACIERLSALLVAAAGGNSAAGSIRVDRERVWKAVAGRIGNKTARQPLLQLTRRPLLAAAAAVVLCVAGAFVWLSHDAPPGKRQAAPALTGARALETGQTSVATSAGKSDTFLCPDGSAVRLAPESAVTFLPPGPGERIRIRLDRGTLDAEVLKAHSGFVVSADGGEVRVVGTLFRVRSFRIHPPSGPALPFLSVEVSRGAVDLAGPQGTRRIAAGARGLVWKNEGPLLQAAEPMDWKAALRKWGATAGDPAFAASPGCAVLLGGSWRGADTWREALADLSAPAELRRAAGTLVGMTAAPEDRDRLLADFHVERDPAIRTGFLPHLARVLASDAPAFLRAVSADDPDPKVREKSAELNR